MYEKTYSGVSLIEINYFRLLVAQYPELSGTYDATIEPDAPGKGDTYTVAVSGQRTYDLMQRVFSDANG